MKKRLSVLVLAIAMVLTMSASVFAATPSGDPSGTGDTAKLVKYFEMDDAVTFPDNASFVINFTPVDSTASEANPATSTAQNSYANVPATAFTNHTYTLSTTALKAGKVSGGYKLAVSVTDLFDGYDFPHAGVYSFTVKEDLTDTDSNHQKANVNGGTVTYDTAEYTLRLGVKNDGTIDDVTVVNEDGDKVDPTDEDPTQAADQTAAGPEGFTFDNTYFKMVTKHDEPKVPNPDDPQSDDPEDRVTPDKTDQESKDYAFSLKKFTNGQYADKTKEFNFTVSVTLPKTASTYEYDAAANVVGDKTLANDGEFGYKALPVGTIITVDETDKNSGGYTTTATTSDANNALTFKVTEDGAFAIYQNDFDDESVTPTGIIINNLPYVLLIGLAIGGIVLFSRKKRYE